MATIPPRLFNKLVTITKLIQTQNDSGDFSNARIVVATDVPMRINVNKTSVTELGGNQSGKFATSTHVGFCSVGLDVNIGYYVEDGTKTYSVDTMDFEPGGELSHHYEIGMTLVKPNSI